MGDIIVIVEFQNMLESDFFYLFIAAAGPCTSDSQILRSFFD